MSSTKNSNDVAAYYSRLGSQLGYKLVMKRSQHFGYYDEKHTNETLAQLNYHQKFAKKLSLKPGMKVLDAGCGQGVVASYLAKNFDVHVTGITITPVEVSSAARFARQQGVSAKTEFILADYANPPFKPNTFDVVYTTETLSHALDVRKVIAALLKVLKPGGRVVFAEYEFDFEKFDDSLRWSAEFIKNHAAIHGIYEFSQGNFRSILETSSLKSVAETDWTKHMMPSFVRIRNIARPVASVVKFLKLEKYFVNSIAGSMYADGVEKESFKYKVYTGTKKD